MHYTISQVAKKYGLARSTLLYYEAIGLLRASKRSSSNYRLFSDKDIARLEKIRELRAAGVPLEKIKEIIAGRANIRYTLLKERLSEINTEIATLRLQQKTIVELLGEKALTKTSRIVSKEQWVQFLEKAGLDEKGMWQWHHEFEACSPEAHQDFLESLHLSKAEIKTIRERSRTL